MKEDYMVVRDDVTIFKLETMFDTITYDLILRGVFNHSEDKMGVFSMIIDPVFHGFGPRGIYLHLEDNYKSMILAYIKQQESK